MWGVSYGRQRTVHQTHCLLRRYGQHEDRQRGGTCGYSPNGGLYRAKQFLFSEALLSLGAQVPLVNPKACSSSSCSRPVSLLAHGLQEAAATLFFQHHYSYMSLATCTAHTRHLSALFAGITGHRAVDSGTVATSHSSVCP